MQCSGKVCKITKNKTKSKLTALFYCTYCSNYSSMRVHRQGRHCARAGRRRRSRRSSTGLRGCPAEVRLLQAGLGRRRGGMARRTGCCSGERCRGRWPAPTSFWQSYGARNPKKKYRDGRENEADLVVGLDDFFTRRGRCRKLEKFYCGFSLLFLLSLLL